MNLEQAQEVVSDFGGFIEYALYQVYTSGKAKLEDYVDAEVAIRELFKNFPDKAKRDAIISNIKNYLVKNTTDTLLISK